MIPHEYAFHRPRERAEVLALLERHGDDAKLLAGGMSLVPILTLGLLQPEVVISLNHLDGLDGIDDDGDVLRIGALTRHATLASDPLVAHHAPVLASAARSIGDVQIRNRGTFGGSLAHADPAADYLPAVLVHGAEMYVERQGGSRRVPAADFFEGLMTTALEPGEMLTEVEVPKPPSGAGGAYARLHRVEGNFAIVAAAALVHPERAALALGGVGPAPIVLDVTDQVRGGRVDLDAIGERAHEASADAVADLNGSAEYRRAMARVYAQRVVKEAAAKGGIAS